MIYLVPGQSVLCWLGMAKNTSRLLARGTEHKLADVQQYHYVYPFSAIVGQESMKLALTLNAINPNVGGLLIRGERGTAKSTAVRAFARVLPEIDVVAGCPYSCDPNDSPTTCHSCGYHRGDSVSSSKISERNFQTVASRTTPLSQTATMVQDNGSFWGGARARHSCEGRNPAQSLALGGRTGQLGPGLRRDDGRKKGLPGFVSHRRKVRVVELPLNATEEMVAGGLDFSASIREGKRAFQPGLLARANRGILYIDEVNLLPDHIVDLILDVCASGVNVVQREGMSLSHPASFILIGTMNPEEGELRPQLLDRFGLCVDVNGEQDLDSRVEVLRRRDSFDRTPQAFVEGVESEESRLRDRISLAREILPNIAISRHLDNLIADMCIRHNVAGHRADIVIENAARALAAWDGRDEATLVDVRMAATFALPHRSRIVASMEETSQGDVAHKSPNVTRRLHDYFDEYPEQEPAQAVPRESRMDTVEFGSVRRPRQGLDLPEAIFDVGETFKVKEIGHQPDKLFRERSGKRSRTRTRHKKGRYVRSTPQRLTDDVALDATLRAAAPHQSKRKKNDDLLVTIRDQDLREKIREARTGNFLLFMVDASGSMASKGRMVASKGAIMSLLKDAYQKRDRVAMISFRQQDAIVNLPPTGSVHLAGKLLRELPVGGKTPLAAGLQKGQAVLRNVLLKDPTCRPILIILTDGKANESVGRGDPFWEAMSVAKVLALDKRIKSIVVDAEEDRGFRYGWSARLAEVLHAEYFRIKDLRADTLLEVIGRGASTLGRGVLGGDRG
jgi:magnesium chelatase subunit D